MGSFNGAFSSMPRLRWAVSPLPAVSRIHLPGERVDEVVMGCVLSAGLGQARRDRRPSAGTSHKVGAVTVNKVCGGSLQSVIMARRAIALGEARIIVAGGMEA